jgi:hypothetical protein
MHISKGCKCLLEEISLIYSPTAALKWGSPLREAPPPPPPPLAGSPPPPPPCGSPAAQEALLVAECHQRRRVDAIIVRARVCIEMHLFAPLTRPVFIPKYLLLSDLL